MKTIAARLDTLHAIIASLGAAVDRTVAGPDRAKAMAQALLPLGQPASLTACWLKESAEAAVLDGEGRPRSDWEAPLRAVLHGTRAGPQQLPAGIGDKAHSLVAQPVLWQGRELAQVAVAAPAEQAELLQSELGVIAQALSAWLGVDELRQELAAEAYQADIGELAGPLMHDISNLLNNLILNLMVMEEGNGDPTAINAPKLRGRIDHASKLIKEVQEYRRKKPPAGQLADVNATVQRAAVLMEQEQAEVMGAPIATSLDLDPGLQPIPAGRSHLMRCLLFLMKNGAKAAQRAGRELRLRTTAAAAAAIVRVEVPGLQVPVESPQRLYDSLAALCPAMSELELAACKSIARRFNGKLHAECASASGLILVLEVPAGEATAAGASAPNHPKGRS